MTEDANGSALCYNDAARMLTNMPELDDQAFLKASQNRTVSKLVLDAALSSLERCVVVDLFDVTSDQDWRPISPTFVSAWFPWLNKGQELLWTNPSTHSVDGRPISMAPRCLPHRLIDEVERLNNLDMEIWKYAVVLMRHQRRALKDFLKKSHKVARAHGAQQAPHLRLYV